MTGPRAIGRSIALGLSMLAITAVFAAAQTAPATAPMTAADVDGLIARAEALVAGRDYAPAQSHLQRALEAARRDGLELQIARALFDQADILQRMGQSAAARPPAEEALALCERLDHAGGIARTSFLLSLIEETSRNEAAARAYATRALTVYEALQDQRGIARSAVQLLELHDGDIDAGRALLDRAVSSAHAAGEAELEGDALHSFGDRLFSVGRYEESLIELNRAAAAYELAGASVDLGTVYNSIGRVYRAHGRLDEALRFQKAALELHQKGTNKLTLLQSLNAVAVIYQRLNELTTARSYMEQAMAVAETAGSPRAQDFLRANMASLLVDLGQPAAAAEAFERVIANGLDSYPSTRYGQLSEAYLQLGRGRDALAAAEQAVALCGDAKDVCIQAYEARSAARAALGDSGAALEDLTVALARLEDLRAHLVPSDFFKQNFHQYYQSVYASSIALQVRGGEERKALETAELARSRSFLDLLASRSLPPPPVSAAAAPVPLTLRGAPRGESTNAAPMAGHAAPASAEDLAATAARLRSTLLLYWVSADDTYVWVVDPRGTIRVRRVHVQRSTLRGLIRETEPFADPGGSTAGALLASATRERPSGPLSLRDTRSAWRRLYTLLILPVADLLPKTPGALLTIVPHDSLSHLSFAALQNGRGRYLLEDYTLHYAPAGAMLQFTVLQQRARPRSGAVLLISDPVPPRQSTLDLPLPRLPGARNEAAAIARLLPARQVTALQDARATEARVRTLAPSGVVLHFATHAVVQDDDPFASYLALARSPGADGADGVLTAQDVYGLHLRADLVVLSACRSGGGTVAGDGIATFARAFLYAGTATLVASVWDVADQPTNRLLPAFYRAWLAGGTKAAALRRAQLRLLADLRAGRVRVATPVGPVQVPEHPVFWAGFMLFGEPG